MSIRDLANAARDEAKAAAEAALQAASTDFQARSAAAARAWFEERCIPNVKVTGFKLTRIPEPGKEPHLKASFRLEDMWGTWGPENDWQDHAPVVAAIHVFYETGGVIREGPNAGTSYTTSADYTFTDLPSLAVALDNLDELRDKYPSVRFTREAS